LVMTVVGVSLVEPSLEDALAAIKAAPLLSDSTQQQWLCSIRQIAKALDRPPSVLPARWTALRIPVDRLHHAQLDITAKTLANHKANLKAALRWMQDKTGGPVRGAPLIPEWAKLRDGITDRGPRARLYGLMRHCSAKGILPQDVTTDVVESYLAYRIKTSSLAGGVAAHRSIARWWNWCAEQVPGWPRNLLCEPELPVKHVGPLWEEFPTQLQAEVKDYLQWLAGFRKSASGKRLRPSKTSTIETRRREIEAFARKAVQIGVETEQLTCLSALFDPDVVDQVIDAYWRENGEEPNTYTIDLVWKLQSIARQANCLDEIALERIDDLRFQLETYRRNGLTDDNFELIRRVLSGPIWSEVVRLPYRLMAEARALREQAPVKAAILAQLAVAVGLLTVAPVRCGNLVRTRLGENLNRPEGPDGPFWLVFPDYDVKNRIRLEFPLKANLTELIEEYLSDHRPVLLRGSMENWLFPGESGSFKTPSMFSEQITEAVEKATGLRVRAHQFRHAAAALILRREPGNYEFVRRVLGHKNYQTTNRFYVGLEPLSANKRFGEIVSEYVTFAEERP
jgi:integrase